MRQAHFAEKIIDQLKKYVKNSFLYLGLAIGSVVLHNVISALIRKDESIFFTLTFVFLVVFIVSLFYNVIYLKGRKK